VKRNPLSTPQSQLIIKHTQLIKKFNINNRREYQEHHERGEHGERRLEHGERRERGEHRGRGERWERRDRSDRGGKRSRPDFTEKQSRIPQPEEIEKIIKQDGVEALHQMIDAAEKFGRHLARENRITTSQVRHAYGTMKKLEMIGWHENTASQVQRQLWLLKPRLAYAAGRHGQGVVDLEKVISTAINHVSDAKSFEHFCQFFEAIIAYHKASGGN
jgi:CRISPR-associated protein Csm2